MIMVRPRLKKLSNILDPEIVFMRCDGNELEMCRQTTETSQREMLRKVIADLIISLFLSTSMQMRVVKYIHDERRISFSLLISQFWIAH